MATSPRRSDHDVRRRAVIEDVGRVSHTLHIVAPDEWINANDRTHRFAVARLTKAWRWAACIAAKDARLPTFDQRVHITAHVHKLHGRQYDATNWAPTAKAAVDGLRDAGVLVDDSNKYVVGPDMRAGERATGRAYLTLTIEEIDDVR